MDSADIYRQIMDHLGDVVWLVDPDFEEIRYINPAYEELTGRSIEQAVGGIETQRSIHPDDRDSFSEWMGDVRSDVESGSVQDEYSIEIRVQRPDGEVRWVETTAVPVFGDDDRIQGVAGITKDVTSRKRHELGLTDQVERLDQFASMITHDLRNPLTVARSELELYRRTCDEANLDGLADTLGRMDDIVTDLTALARESTPDGQFRDVSLPAVATDAWDAVDTRSATLATDECTIEGDRGQLQVLFENLFKNAVGHGGESVTVRVGSIQDGFFVEDTGTGIPEDVRDQIFDHGFSTGYSGSGVGLTIVRRIAEVHSLSVSLSESHAGGARFEFQHQDQQS